MITKKSTANYRIGSSKQWFELGIEELGKGYSLTETESNPDPIRPKLRWFITQSLEEADTRNYERAKEIVKQRFTQ